jgi:protein-tyrosine phosphatase
MWQILPDLFLGDRGTARDLPRLRERGITHVVNCSKELSCYFPDEFEYLWLRLGDPDPRFSAEITRFCNFIDAGRATGKVLVHCTGGVSRSPAVLLAYLIHLCGDLEEAVADLSRAVDTGIDLEFLQQIAHWRGLSLSPAEIQAMQWKLLRRA